MNYASEQARDLAFWAPLIDHTYELVRVSAPDYQVGTNQRWSGEPTTLGQCMEFDGTTNSANAYDISGEYALSDPSNTKFSMGCWIRPYVVTGSAWWITLHNAAHTAAFTFGFRDFGVPKVESSGQNSPPNLGGSTVLVAGQVYHVLCTCTGVSWRIFVNGISENLGGTQPTSFTPALVEVGRYDGNFDPFNGQIADVRFYNRELSSNEIYRLYAPETRWELYAQPNRRSYFFLSTAPIGAKIIFKNTAYA